MQKVKCATSNGKIAMRMGFVAMLKTVDTMSKTEFAMGSVSCAMRKP